jgi:hypothetical protein
MFSRAGTHRYTALTKLALRVFLFFFAFQQATLCCLCLAERWMLDVERSAFALS